MATLNGTFKDFKALEATLPQPPPNHRSNSSSGENLIRATIPPAHRSAADHCRTATRLGNCAFPFSRLCRPFALLIGWKTIGGASNQGAHAASRRPFREDEVLKSIDPLLNPDLLYALAAMGHGDVLAIVDSNFPVDSVARRTVIGKPLRLDGVSAPRAAEAVLSLLPLDTFIPTSALRMEVVGKPEEWTDVQVEFQAVIDRCEGPGFRLGSIERFAFYEAAKNAYAVLQTGERRLYGCFLLTKGVIPPKT
jgi:L-fucose mutarotase